MKYRPITNNQHATHHVLPVAKLGFEAIYDVSSKSFHLSQLLNDA